MVVCAGVQGQCGGSSVLQYATLSLLPSLQTLAVGAVCSTGHHTALSTRYFELKISKTRLQNHVMIVRSKKAASVPGGCEEYPQLC